MRDGVIRLIDLAHPRAARVVRFDADAADSAGSAKPRASMPAAIAFSNDSRAIGGALDFPDGSIEIRSLADGSITRTYQVPRGVRSVLYMSDGHGLLGRPRSLRHCVGNKHRSDQDLCAFDRRIHIRRTIPSPDSANIQAAGVGEPAVRHHRRYHRSIQRNRLLLTNRRDAAIAPDGSRVITASGHVPLLWRAGGEKPGVLPDIAWASATFLPSGDTILFGDMGATATSCS